MQGPQVPSPITLGTGTGGSAPATWTPADILALVMGGGLVSIVLGALLCMVIVRQTDVRSTLALLAGTGIGAIAGVLVGGRQQPTHGANSGTQIDNAETVQVPPTPPVSAP